MSDISMKRAHNMDLAKAKETTEKIIQEVQSNFPALVDTIKWNGDKTAADVKGKGFKGTFAVDATNIAIDIKLGLFAKPFKGKVEERMKSMSAKYFG